MAGNGLPLMGVGVDMFGDSRPHIPNLGKIWKEVMY